MKQFGIESDVDVRTKLPKQYEVYVLNDDVSPMDFVEEVLSEIFKKNKTEAMSIMQHAHNTGKALVGVYIRDVASTRVHIAEAVAEDAGFPLKFKIKEA